MSESKSGLQIPYGELQQFWESARRQLDENTDGSLEEDIQHAISAFARQFLGHLHPSFSPSLSARALAIPKIRWEIEQMLFSDSELRSEEQLASWAGEIAYQHRLPFVRYLHHIQSAPPTWLLGASGLSGSLLAEGAVMMLAGDGGIGKSILTLQLALGLAGIEEDKEDTLPGNIFRGKGGKVLMMSYEDDDGAQLARCRRILSAILEKRIPARTTWDAERAEARTLIASDLMCEPLFGPGKEGFYNARPCKLEAWELMEEWVASFSPRYLVIDPVLASFVGNPNDAAPVREFIGHLSVMAKQFQLGVILIAHSTKSSRGTGNKGAETAFDVGTVAGSAAWFDAPRSVVGLKWTHDPNTRRMPIIKANYGSSRKQASLTASHESTLEGDEILRGFWCDPGPGKWEGETSSRKQEEQDTDGGFTTTRDDAPDKF